MSPSTPVLFVAWQDAASRKILPVGRLLRATDGYEFVYIEAVREALKLGFSPLMTFPKLDVVYRSVALPPLFSNRLMSASREDFPEHLQRLGLDVDEREPFTILARSSGRRETDKLEVFAPPQTTGGAARGLFLVRGLRHTSGGEAAAEHLQPEDSLVVTADTENAANPAALTLSNRDGEKLGFVPDYLAQELADRELQGDLLKVTVARISLPPAPVHHRVLCRFEYPVKDGDLFTGPRYQPLSGAVSAA